MALPRFTQPYITRWITSDARLRRRRKRFAAKRAVSGRVFEFFYRADDPVSHIMAQAIRTLRPMLQGRLHVHVVERLPADAYPDPARFEALSIIDSQRLADVYGFDLPPIGKVAQRLGVQMASRHLAQIEDADACLDAAISLGQLIWQGDSNAVQRLCSMATFDEDRIRASEQRLLKLGHYASGSLYFEGEFYVGPDRLYHLIERLEGEGLQVPADDHARMLAQRLDWQMIPGLGPESLSAKTAQVYFSVRSPYSYLLLAQLPALVGHTRLRVMPRPVLPMVMRGMKIPPAKRHYILSDAKREAVARDIPFGQISDPIGAPTERALSIGLAIDDPADQLAYFLKYMTAVFAEGRSASATATHIYALSAVGLPTGMVHQPLPASKWQALVRQNSQDMLLRGAWGVPTIVTEKNTYFGQDRLWAAAADLKGL